MIERILNSVRGSNMGGNEYRVLNVPRASIYRVAAITSLVANAVTRHPFDTVEYDTNSMWDSANPNRLNCITPGVYLVTGAVSFAVDTTGGYRLAFIGKNNGLATQVYYTDTVSPPPTSAAAELRVAHPVQMNAGDYVELFVQSGAAGVPFSSTAAARANELTATLISTL